MVSKRSYATESPRKVTTLGKVSPIRLVPENVARPPYVGQANFSSADMYGNMPEVPLLTPETLPRMKRSCKLARKILDFAKTLVRPGITTEAIDEAVHQRIVEEGAYPSPLGYMGFPKSICTSINNVICHGIPDDQTLFDGDIINIDVTVYIDGYHGDCSETLLVGDNVSQSAKRLVNVAREARDKAIAVCGPGLPFSIIGHTIETVCRQNGYSCPATLTGHGIGPIFHADPFILHVENDHPGTMKPGMAFTIEPVICEGSDKFYMAPDNWTIFSRDGKWNAQFEHTILITETGHEILTL